MDDLADAHVHALDRLEPGSPLSASSGLAPGISVKEIIAVAERVTGKRATVIWGARREGDPPDLYADAHLAERLLDWKAQHPTADEIVASACRWMSRHPRGYGGGQ